MVGDDFTVRYSRENDDLVIRVCGLNSNFDLRGSPRGRLWWETRSNDDLVIRVCGVARSQYFRGFLIKIAEKVSIPFFRIPPNVRTTVRLLKRALVLFALVMQARRKEGPQVTRSVTWRWMRRARFRRYQSFCKSSKSLVICGYVTSSSTTSVVPLLRWRRLRARGDSPQLGGYPHR